MPAADAATEHHQIQLTETYATIREWSDSAYRLETEAEDAGRTARLLDDELSQLRGIFDPLRALHTRSTWEGRAADQSRRRLDQHEDEYLTGLRRIDRLVDELNARAIVARRAADVSRDSIESARRQAWKLEAELRRLDGHLLLGAIVH